MRLNTQLAQEVWETGATITLADLDQRFHALLQELEASSTCRRGESHPPNITKEQWLQAQWTTIQKLAQGIVGARSIGGLTAWPCDGGP